MYAFGPTNGVPAQIYMPQESPRAIMFRSSRIGRISLAFQVQTTSSMQEALERFGSWEKSIKGGTFQILGQDKDPLDE